jgi:hypothetical protein
MLTVIDFFSKNQSLDQTATFGLEYMSARMATEQIIEPLTKLRYLGVRIKSASYLFGDNKTAAISIPPLSSTNGMFLYPIIGREATTAHILHFVFICGSINPADILYKAIWPMLKVWEGDAGFIE